MKGLEEYRAIKKHGSINMNWYTLIISLVFSIFLSGAFTLGLFLRLDITPGVIMFVGILLFIQFDKMRRLELDKQLMWACREGYTYKQYLEGLELNKK